jgi:CheY-like chemotaxis protein
MEESKKKTVLVVDDERDLRDMIVMALSAKGYCVLSAPDGQEALDIVEANVVDAVISDLRMPFVDGMELLERLKLLDVWKPIVVLMSAYHDLSSADAYEGGAEGFLTKPFRMVNVHDSLQRLLIGPEQRWSLPPTEPPEQQMSLRVPSIEAGRQQRILDLGRGGMCMRCEGPAPKRDERVAFAVDIDKGPIPRLAGTAVVRWTRRESGRDALPTCGLEFESLGEDSLGDVLAWLDREKPVTYIPCFRDQPSIGN